MGMHDVLGPVVVSIEKKEVPRDGELSRVLIQTCEVRLST